MMLLAEQVKQGAVTRMGQSIVFMKDMIINAQKESIEKTNVNALKFNLI
jgi:hypothetical protein